MEVRMRWLFLAMVGGCAGDPGSGGGEAPPAGANVGQTGQSGTEGLTCGELDAFHEEVDFAEIGDLGFSVADALAALQPFSGTVQWSDGPTTALHGSVGLDPDDLEPWALEEAIEVDGECARVLEFRAVTSVSTDDGRLVEDFVSNEFTVAALGSGFVGGTGSSEYIGVDLSHVPAGGPPGDSTTGGGGSTTNVAWYVTADGPSSDGYIRLFQDGEWLDVGTW